MNVIRMSNRLTATGAAAALAAAALVGVTGTAAHAASVTNTYTCANANLPGVGPWDVTLVTAAPGIEGFTEVPAGIDLASNSLSVTNTFTMPKAAHDTLIGYGATDLDFPDFAGSFGGEAIGVAGMTAKVADMTENSDGTWSFDSDGLNEAFSGPVAGSFPVLSPSAFNIVATVPGLGSAPVLCELAEGTAAGAYHDVTVFKNASETSGKPVAKTLKATQVAKMKVAVAGPDFQTPGGKVILKEGAKTLGSAMLNDAGVATVKMGKLKRGKHAVTAFYKGDGYTLTSTSKKIVFKVARR